MRSDPALDALWLPFAQGLLKPEADVLFLRAREGAALHASGLRAGLHCVQPFKPWADALQRAGFAVRPEADDTRTHAQVWLLPPRQREEARALLATALDRCAPGGVVLASVANEEGAKAHEGDLRRLVGGLEGTLSKFHCRVFWARRDEARIDHDLLAQWREADAVRPILDGRFHSRPGVFAWNRVDAGSALLAEALPGDLAGRAADLGGGWGWLSAALLAKNPRITALDLYEADHRALQLAARNLAPFAQRVALDLHWHDVEAGLPHTARCDVVVCNPPFHDPGKAARPGIGQRFIEVAADALQAQGELWLVANARLPYEATLQARFAQTRTVLAARGFKVLHARGPRR
ncbi:class I SAM-dependent methyltransferase [Luteimonas sp. e5]